MNDQVRWQSSGGVVLDEAEVGEMDAHMQGVCADCGEWHDCCEPDTLGRRCESCGAKAVTGPHWVPLTWEEA